MLLKVVVGYVPLSKHGNASRCVVVKYVDDLLMGKLLLKVVIGCHFQAVNAPRCVVTEHKDDVLKGKSQLKFVVGGGGGGFEVRCLLRNAVVLVGCYTRGFVSCFKMCSSRAN